MIGDQTGGRPADFTVGGIPVYGRAILSPMAGYSDVPYRAICRAYGSAMHYTEFVPVEALLGRPARNHFWQRLDRLPGEHPLVFQIFGNDPGKILAAADNIRPLEPDIIDVNMGCSTRRVSGRGAGVGMMRSPDIIAETFRLLTNHLDLPITGKIRLGWDDLQNYLEVAHILEDNGAALVALHGRTKEQKYGGEANWEAIARLVDSVSIPVIGNGDITTPEQIDQMLNFTGCAAVMIGRGAIGNPWIFARRSRSSLTFEELAAGIRRHLNEMLAYHGSPYGLILFRKHFKRYVEGIDGLDDLVESMVLAGEPDTFLSLLAAAEERMAARAPGPMAWLQASRAVVETAGSGC